MTNRLVSETSPYLLQHADNPVDWYPYGRAALERAAQENKPLLISIGYSACHWCHVMAHESFEDPDVAAVMNDNFVNVKVDREERPDVDAIYMEAVQGMTGHGGWPLNVFAAPDGKPFFGGTYFPPVARHGLPAWRDVLAGVASAYRDRRQEVTESADSIADYLRRAQATTADPVDLSPQILRSAAEATLTQVDWANGGFGSAPKFPQPLGLEWLLRVWRKSGTTEALDAARLALDRMAAGGIYDQVGGGFHRYSVDESWVVPHFEKMLYDNALLARVYLHAYQATGDAHYRRVVEETLTYLLREMQDPGGGFYSAQDADSEGVEGKYYVWTREEFERVLGPEDARIAALRFGVTPAGNFEGSTVLTIHATAAEIAADVGMAERVVEERLGAIRKRLYAARRHRVPPGTDTKILTAWNALAIRALAEAGAVFERHDWLDTAERAADFVLESMRPGGQLVRSYRDGPGHVLAFLEDYAYLAEGLISLYESTFRPDLLNEAERLIAEMVRLFEDPRGGAFFDSRASDDLVVRPRSFFDNPVPSGNSAASFALLRLHALTGNEMYLNLALPASGAVGEVLSRAPLGFSYLLSAVDFHLGPPVQIAIAGRPRSDAAVALLREVRDLYLPNAVVAAGESGSVGLLDGRREVDGQATAYVCRHFACRLPVTTGSELRAQLEGQGE